MGFFNKKPKKDSGLFGNKYEPDAWLNLFEYYRNNILKKSGLGNLEKHVL